MDKTTQQKITTKTAAHPYENNPFFIATTGIELLFKKAQSIGIILAVIAGLSALAGLPSLFMQSAASPSQPQTTATSPSQSQQTFESFIHAVPLGVWLLLALLVLFGLLVVITVGSIIRGIQDYTSSQIAHDRTVSLNEAFRVVFHAFWGYLWVLTVVGIKVLLWSLLFIVPGIIMSVRYSLAGVAYFDKSLKGNQAAQYSAQITKGGWLTTFASQRLLNIITFGAIPSLLSPGTNAVLYRQFTSVSETKPKAHVLSWLTLLVPIVFAILIIILVMTIIAIIGMQLQNG